jgi:Plasmid pRiA4b ORF-3-like protein
MDRFVTPNAVQVHASLDDIKPAIWRQLLVPLDFSLRELHLSDAAGGNCWHRPAPC